MFAIKELSRSHFFEKNEHSISNVLSSPAMKVIPLSEGLVSSLSETHLS